MAVEMKEIAGTMTSSPSPMPSDCKRHLQRHSAVHGGSGHKRNAGMRRIRVRSARPWDESRPTESLARTSSISSRSRAPETGQFGTPIGFEYRIEDVSVYDERREELEKHEFMMGVPRGRLAVTLDVLTDALVLVGQHGVYCQSARQPGKPAMDIQIITKSIADAKELIGGVMIELKAARA